MTRTVIFIIAVLVITPALAFVYGGSNLGFGGYPAHNCYKPHFPYGGEFSSEWERDSYVRDWNSFIDCVNEYIDAGNNDIDRIREAQQNAISDAKTRH